MSGEQPYPPTGAPQPGYPPRAYPQPGVDPRYGYATPPVYPPVFAPPPPPPVESPTPYHRLFRTNPRYAWWRPLVAGVLFLVFGLVAIIALSVAYLVAALVSGAFEVSDLLAPGFEARLLEESTDVANPLSLFLLLGTLAVLLPMVPLAMLCAGLRPVGLRHSVAFRLRWGWMLRCVVPSLVVTAASIAVPLGIALLAGETIEPVFVEPALFALLAVLIVLLTPLQAAAEEYVFRGLVMQIVGAWVRWAPVGMLVSTVLFTIGHTQYELWGMLSVGVMGLGFAVVVWRTGGLEAAIALHTVNNVIALMLLASGATGTTRMGSEGSGPLAVVLQLVFTAGFVLWIELLARRHGIQRTRVLTPQPPPA